MIGAALTVNCSLTSLDLHCNKIGDAGAAAIAEALKVNDVLTKLKLNGNNLGAEASKSLKQASHARLELSL